jgi:hypothetical protein
VPAVSIGPLKKVYAKRFRNRGELRRVFYVWRWPKRLDCHGSLMPCQYVDDPNDNHR